MGKELHDKRARVGRQTGEYTEPDLDTVFGCLNSMRKRSDAILNRSVGLESFEHALDSADGAEIFTVWEKQDSEEVRTIVRNLKDDWQQDNKFISAPLGKGFQNGNTVTWKRLGIRWLLVWQDFNYSSHYRGEMYRASHLLTWKDSNGIIQKQWASVRGPVETKAKYDNVGGEYMGGRQNDTLDVWIGSNDKHAVASLARFDKIKIGTRTWRIVVRDDISNPNVLRFSCIENFNNDYTDDVINGTPDGLVEFPKEVLPSENKIVLVGPNSIKEGFSKTYSAKIDDLFVEGDFKVLNSKGEIVLESYGHTITIKGTEIGDILRIEFYQNGELETSGEISVVSIFGG